MTIIFPHVKVKKELGTLQKFMIGMCIWACFTSFYRGGELNVSALSALLMSVFFTLLGVTLGVFTGSFTLGKDKKAAAFRILKSFDLFHQ